MATKTGSMSLLVDRRFTDGETNPYDMVKWTRRDSQITNQKGEVISSLQNAEAPEEWSQLALDIAVSKYFRKAGLPGIGHETSVRQLVRRVTHALFIEGERMGYFDSETGKTFEDELAYVLLTQRGAFNSPVWFNLGLYHEYGIAGSGGNYHWDQHSDNIRQAENAYQRPQCSACFIQSVDDDLMSIFDLVRNEARVFKYGSGSGTNFSGIRGKMEQLSGGGTSSGLMSFLDVFDRAAGATKSGGTTRRAAKMVILDVDHPEIREFVKWKVREERKVGALIAAGYDSDFNGEAYRTVSGQNANNSVRISDAFMQAVAADGDWSTTLRTDGSPFETFKARDLFRDISEAAWASADPGVQFHDTINRWHTCKHSGPINASNPCSEYMFLDNTACNLASINLMKYLREDGSFDVEDFKHTVRLFILAQDIIVDASSYPTEPIARNSHLYRTLGLGYANLGTLLMVKGLPYDSEKARVFSSAITSLMTGEAYRVSAEIARQMGPFAGFARNRDDMLEVIRMHGEATRSIERRRLSGPDEEILESAIEAWDASYEWGDRSGFRNAQVSVLAPTGTIGLFMDCDTTGVEPDYALVKWKKLAGGGRLKIVNGSVSMALQALGYTAEQSLDIITYITGSLNFDKSPHINRDTLKAKGLRDEEIGRAEAALSYSMSLNDAFQSEIIGADAYVRLGLDPAKSRQLLTNLGFSEAQIVMGEDHILGRGTIEGAPHLKDEHLPVFDTANRNGRTGRRFIEPMGHIRMMAAVQPFLSGAISKTVNLPAEATVEDIETIYQDAWRMGLKAVALYRDGCKYSQPLSVKKKIEEQKTAEQYKERIAELEAELAEQKELLRKALLPKPFRRKLPKRRRGITQEARIGGHKLYLRTGEYEDGSLGEIFVDLHKEGATFRSIMNMFAIAISVGLQHGVPLDEFVDIFTHHRFDPQGVTDHPRIKRTSSIVDFIFRVLAVEYLGRDDLAQVPPSMDNAEENGGGAAVGEASFATMTPAPVAGASRGGVATDASVATVPSARVMLRPAAAVADGAAGPANPLATATSNMNQSLSQLMGDAPVCDICGNLTVRNGSCYKCPNCGTSMGCS